MEPASAAEPREGRGSLADCAASWAVARRVRVGAEVFRYREAGSGPPIVLVHGLGISADYWWRNGPALAASGYRVLAPDLPGFGGTEGPLHGLSVPQQANALVVFARALGVEGAVYVGHSLSCQSALLLAAESPALVRGLVLAAPTGAAGRFRGLRQLLGFAADIPRESVRLVTEAARAYLLAGPIRVFKTWRLAIHNAPLEILDAVEAPGIVLVGSRDPIVPPDFARALADGLPGGRLVRVEGAAHGVIFTHAAEVNRCILELSREVFND